MSASQKTAFPQFTVKEKLQNKYTANWLPEKTTFRPFRVEEKLQNKLVPTKTFQNKYTTNVYGAYPKTLLFLPLERRKSFKIKYNAKHTFVFHGNQIEA